jgi:hypothetical protein
MLNFYHTEDMARLTTYIRVSDTTSTNQSIQVILNRFYFNVLTHLRGPESVDKLVVQLASLRVLDSWEGVGLCPLRGKKQVLF